MKVAVLGATQFNFPIRRPDYRLAHETAGSTIVRTLVTARGARFVRASVDVHHVGHRPDYIADADNPVLCLPGGFRWSLANG